MDGMRMRRFAMTALALVLILQAGCALAVVGCAAGGAAATYAYLKGVLIRDYPAMLGDTIAAARTALTELGFPIIKEKTDTGTAYITSKTADGHAITLYFDVVPSSVPTDGAMTRVAVRVGYTGDDVVSARILDQITKHIKPSLGLPPALPPAPPGAPPVTAVPPGAPIAATPTRTTTPETPPPPLATATTGTTTPLPKR
jgi:hypothetical protein